MRQEDDNTPPPLPEACDATSASLVKKTRSRKKVAVPPPDQEQGSVIQAEPGEASVQETPRRRRKKTGDPVVEDPAPEVKVSSRDSGEASSGLMDAGDAVSSTKPRRTRRVGERKPKRDRVGEPEEEHHG